MGKSIYKPSPKEAFTEVDFTYIQIPPISHKYFEATTQADFKSEIQELKPEV
jgi:hypothetical protein